MRFVRLRVESFKAVKLAEVAFGPGLNIVFGPNDLGKSTLATAIQAALLVPSSSTEAHEYTSWYVDSTPRVTLEFLDDTGRYWRVIKAFGDEDTAELFASKDGQSFSLESKQRAVDGKLRDLLGWGIAPPGGKGAPRGLPESFLREVLLAPQTNVGGILGMSLAGDHADTGRIRLNKALATLAQDPMFKKVLDKAQQEIDQVFTPKFQLKKRSALALASSAVKELRGQLDSARTDQDKSVTVEAEVDRLRELYIEAQRRFTEARERREDTFGRFEATKTRETAVEALAGAQANVDRLNEETRAVQRLVAEVAQLKQDAAAKEAAVAGENEKLRAAEQALRLAEEQLRVEQSEASAQAREVEKARLQKDAAEVQAEIQQILMQQEKVLAAEAAEKLADQSAGEVRAAEKAAAGARKALAAAEGELPAAERAVVSTKSLRAYGRWRVASERAAEAKAATERSAAMRSKSAALAARAAEDADLIRRDFESLKLREQFLPENIEIHAIQQLERERDVAEAALGGGVSVVVTGPGRGEIKTALDGAKTKALPPSGVVEADRTVTLFLEGVEINVTAGSPDKRKQVEALREAWKTRGAPVLEQAQVSSVAELATLAQRLAADKRSLSTRQSELERAEAEAKQLLDQAEELDRRHHQEGRTPEQLGELKSLFNAELEPAHASEFAKLGYSWETKVDQLQAAAELKLREVGDRVSKLKGPLGEATAALSAANKAWETSRANAQSLALPFGPMTLDQKLREVKALLSAMKERAQKLGAAVAALDETSNQDLARAQGAVRTAELAVEASRAAVASAMHALETARATYNRRSGELAHAQASLGQRDRLGIESAVARCKTELDALPVLEPATASDLAQAEEDERAANRHVEQSSQNLHTAEGALSQVGGAVAAERVERLIDAIRAAEARERDMSLDAEAWKLLHETMRTVENEEGAHLGRALAAPVAKRFSELTERRYTGIKIDTNLKTESVDVPGGLTADVDVIKALSVGTRDQLATLVRLTIAEQLKTAILLDDQLVHTDASRLRWFGDAFLKATLENQVIVLTCQPAHYLDTADLTSRPEASWELAAGRVRVLDAARLIERFAPADEIRSGRGPAKSSQ